MRPDLGHLLAVLLLLAPLAGGSASAAVEPENLSPSQVVQQTADDVIAVLRQRELPLPERRRRIEEIAYQRFDLDSIARLVLARYWRQFSEPQRKEFVEAFKQHLVENYGDRIDRYDQETIEILGERAEPQGDVTVRTRMVGGEANGTAVDYRLRRRDGRWYVLDVVVEGVSVLKSYRSQFQQILSRGGPEQLLKELREKKPQHRSPTSASTTSPRS